MQFEPDPLLMDVKVYVYKATSLVWLYSSVDSLIFLRRSAFNLSLQEFVFVVLHPLPFLLLFWISGLRQQP